ncbi:MAG: ribosome-associated translation inhibitor RaiA [Alphaproteobacteria bacterium]|nr:ribosome-associated translation inhibitor RaiA [Alphaproteobacteria bacterium]
MQLSVSGKHLDVGEALRSHVETALAGAVERHFGQAIEGKVTFAKSRHRFRADISVHPARGMLVQSHGEADDAYAAFDGAIQRLETRLQRYKGRLVERRKAAESDTGVLAEAQTYTVTDKPGDDGGAEDRAHGSPAIVAETIQTVATLSLREAVIQMDLADTDVLLFRNRSHGGYGVVHRRADGSIGWIDAGPLPSR